MNMTKSYLDYNSMNTFLIRFAELDNESMKELKLNNNTNHSIYGVYNESNIVIGIVIFDAFVSELWAFIPFKNIIINSIEMNQINDFLRWITDLNIKEMC